MRITPLVGERDMTCSPRPAMNAQNGNRAGASRNERVFTDDNLLPTNALFPQKATMGGSKPIHIGGHQDDYLERGKAMGSD